MKIPEKTVVSLKQTRLDAALNLKHPAKKEVTI